jgi:nitrogen fixation/metabolism regulation signal transduction histidine kinase
VRERRNGGAGAARKPKAGGVPHDARVFRLALLGGLPAILATVGLLIAFDAGAKVGWTVSVVVICCWFFAALALRERVLRPLQTASNLVAALREGDFSVRGRAARLADPLGELMFELNQLSDLLREQRLGSLEAGALLSRVMEEIDVAVLAFEEGGKAVLANRAAEKLLGAELSRLPSPEARQLGLAAVLDGPAPRTLELTLPGGAGKFELKRTSFRLGGKPHVLVVLADLRRALREEERQAWQRLVRVLGHEINNSLAPIRSISASLREMAAPGDRHEGWEQDLKDGLAVIERRAESLSRFMTSYAKLARLPPPRLGPVEVEEWIERVAALEKRIPVRVASGPEMRIEADADQLDQLLINLVRNAADASLETRGGVVVTWSAGASELEVSVADEGPGIADSGNLFVPFFTTKPQGTGIGLALSRQIAELHHGSLTLENRTDRRGARARLRLPIRPTRGDPDLQMS